MPSFLTPPPGLALCPTQPPRGARQETCSLKTLVDLGKVFIVEGASCKAPPPRPPVGATDSFLHCPRVPLCPCQPPHPCPTSLSDVPSTFQPPSLRVVGLPATFKHEQDAYCVPSFKQRAGAESSVLAVWPEAQVPSHAQRGRPATPTPFSTGCTRCWQHLETGLKIVSLMSQC